MFIDLFLRWPCSAGNTTIRVKMGERGALGWVRRTIGSRLVDRQWMAFRKSFQLGGNKGEAADASPEPENYSISLSSLIRMSDLFSKQLE
jgi:hypothetical protein